VLSFVADDELRHSIDGFFDYLLNNELIDYPLVCQGFVITRHRWLPRSQGSEKHREDLYGELERRLPTVIQNQPFQMRIARINNTAVPIDVRPFGWSHEPITCLLCLSR